MQKYKKMQEMPPISKVFWWGDDHKKIFLDYQFAA
ncbi:hypothetical protein EDC33_0645 [Salinicoccus roseus]|nr:hypothetical protein EDC33_0645 [Salinicoccus roseus]